jgi:hypothetical protein
MNQAEAAEFKNVMKNMKALHWEDTGRSQSKVYKNEAIGPIDPSRSRSHVLSAALVATCLYWPCQANGQLFLDVGVRDIQPNTPNQTLDFFVDNTGFDVQVTALNFNIQIADGGAGAGGSISGPAIAGVDLASGTAFAENNTGPTDNGSVSQAAFWSVTTSSGTVTLPGGTLTKIASVTLDSTGFGTPGMTWDLLLGNTIGGPTQYVDTIGNPIDIGITDGTLRLAAVPEPEQVAFASAGLLVAFALIRRRIIRSAHS